MKYGTFQEAVTAWQADRDTWIEKGLSFEHGAEPRTYVPEEFRRNFSLAMDAQPALVTDPNSAVPAFLTTMIDPEVYEVLFAANKGAEILGEKRKGTWLDETAMFPTIEHTGEVSTYGDWNANGVAGVNTNWPQRQSYLFQTVKEYGERELERAGLARINWVSEKDKAAATVLNKFLNYTYFFGVQGLQNYGLLNDPDLPASITPAPKAYGGTKWIVGGVVVATANEIYTDIQSMFYQLQQQTNGLVEQDTKLVIALGPAVQVALTATNSFNVNVSDLLKKNFPNIRVENAVQYQVATASNPQGLASGNTVQMIVEELEGQDTGYCSFNERMRSHPIIRDMSSFRQKVTSGTWGAILRMPVAIVTLVGV